MVCKWCGMRGLSSCAGGVGGVTSLEKQPLSSFIRISLSHVRRAGKKENEKLAAPKVLLWLSRLLDNFVVK